MIDLLGFLDFPLAKFLGLSLEDAVDGRAIVSGAITEAYINSQEAVHGAVIFTLIDTAMAAATKSVLKPGQRCATIEISARFFRPVFVGTLSSVATVQKAGSRVVQLSARVLDHTDQVVGSGSGSFAII